MKHLLYITSLFLFLSPLSFASYAPGGGGLTITLWGNCSESSTSSVNCSAGEGTASCPSGWSELYAGYGPMIIYNSYGAASVEVCSTTGTVYYPSGGQSASVTANITYYTGSYPNYWYYANANTCRVCLKE